MLSQRIIFIVHKYLDCIYSDYSVGFSLGFVNWISPYLENRSYKVKFRDVVSKSFIVKSGVPQGSHLGSLLFIQALNDAPLCIHHSESIQLVNDRGLLQECIPISFCYMV